MMSPEERPPTTMDIYVRLIGLTPKPRMIAGAVCIAGGVATTVLLWNRGVVWGYAIFAFIAGIFLFFSGITGMSRQRARAAQLADFRTRQTQLLDAMVEEKRQGRNPVRWLNDQGIHDPEFRSILLEALAERLRAGGPPEEPAKRQR